MELHGELDHAPAPAHRSRTLAIAVFTILALAITAAVSYRWGSAGSSNPPAATATATPTPSRTPTTAEVYNALAPSVVTIQGLRRGSNAVDTGTGVIVNANGTILTALHVVKEADTVRLTYADGSTSAATIAASEPAMDIATLTPRTLPSVVVPAVLGGQAAVGDGVIAIGNQLGLTRSTTTGVVSGLDRQARSRDGETLSGLIQFDAAVNPGSSGGPLLNAKGQTIGIVVALANPTSAKTFVGIGFAVPIGAAAGAGGDGQGPAQ